MQFLEPKDISVDLAQNLGNAERVMPLVGANTAMDIVRGDHETRPGGDISRRMTFLIPGVTGRTRAGPAARATPHRGSVRQPRDPGGRKLSISGWRRAWLRRSPKMVQRKEARREADRGAEPKCRSLIRAAPRTRLTMVKGAPGESGWPRRRGHRGGRAAGQVARAEASQGAGVRRGPSHGR